MEEEGREKIKKKKEREKKEKEKEKQCIYLMINLKKLFVSDNLNY